MTVLAQHHSQSKAPPLELMQASDQQRSVRRCQAHSTENRTYTIAGQLIVYPAAASFGRCNSASSRESYVNCGNYDGICLPVVRTTDPTTQALCSLPKHHSRPKVLINNDVAKMPKISCHVYSRTCTCSCILKSMFHKYALRTNDTFLKLNHHTECRRVNIRDHVLKCCSCQEAPDRISHELK